jgi:hypothetical protein
MDDPFDLERKTVGRKKQNLFGSGYAGLGFCYCEKFRLSSKVGSPDWRIVIETFKDNYC